LTTSGLAKSSTTAARIVLAAAVRAGRFCSIMAIGALLRLLARVPEARRTDIGLSTDPMRSITDKVRMPVTSSRVSASLASQATRSARRGSASPGHGSRLAAALASLAGT
jgi:hypothetical protein